MGWRVLLSCGVELWGALRRIGRGAPLLAPSLVANHIEAEEAQALPGGGLLNRPLLPLHLCSPGPACRYMDHAPCMACTHVGAFSCALEKELELLPHVCYLCALLG